MAENITVFSRGTFHFQLGKPPQSFHLHTELVAKHSPELAALMTGHMREAQEEIATIGDIEVGSFTSFAEYIYGGNYNLGHPPVKDELQEYPLENCFVEELNDEDQIWGTLSKSSKKKAQKATVKKAPLSLTDDSVVTPVTETFPAISNGPFQVLGSDTKCDFTEVLLCHARVYSMADRFQVPKLKELAIFKIHKALLQIINLDHCYVGDLISLVDYVYSNTPELETSKDALRDLLSRYVALNFRNWMEEDNFQAYLRENGAFMLDVCAQVSMRL